MSILTSRDLAIEVLNWQDVRDRVNAVKPALANAIDMIKPGARYKLIMAKYRFGDYLLKKGCLQLPTLNGQPIAIHNPKVPASLRKQLDYANITPLSLILDHGLELFAEHEIFHASYKQWRQGDFFGLSSIFQNSMVSTQASKIWSIVAGSRSLIILPKVSDAINHKQIQTHYKIDSPTPKTFENQWDTLAEIAQHEPICKNWKVKVLYFTHNWAATQDNKRWQPFWQYLHSTLISNTQSFQDCTVFDYALSCALMSKNLKSNPFITNIIKQLFAIYTGIYPAFRIAEDDNIAPISALQKTYTEIYDLKYAPTIAHLSHFDQFDANVPHYLSLQLPNLLAFSSKPKKTSSKLEDLQEIHYVMSRLVDFLLKDELGLKDTVIYEWAEKIHYDFFHTGPFEKATEGILHTSEMPKGDLVLAKHLSNYPNLPFCENSPFIRGCICISQK